MLNKTCLQSTRTCFLFPESQQHLTVCLVLKAKFNNVIDFSKLDHRMVFQNLTRQETFTKQYILLLKGREYLLNENTDAGWSKWRYLFLQNGGPWARVIWCWDTFMHYVYLYFIGNILIDWLICSNNNAVCY